MAQPRTCPDCRYPVRECICEDENEQQWRAFERFVREDEGDCYE